MRSAAILTVKDSKRKNLRPRTTFQLIFFFFHSDFEITDFREQMEHTINLSSWKADIVRNEADEIALFS